MKILLLSDPDSSHTIKWAKSLSEKGIKLFIFGLSNYNSSNYHGLKNLETFTMGFDTSIIKSGESNLSKLRYLRALPELKKIIKKFQPDILHAHYATSYGLIGALSGFTPFILSIWGSDIFNFPKKSFLHKSLIKHNLKKADVILSTSHIMAKEIENYTDKYIEVTPFGIDINSFRVKQVKNLFYKEDIVIGTIKTLEKNYGIEYLIKAFKILQDRNKNLTLKLLIVGGGSQEEYLKKMVNELNLNKSTIFTGKVEYKDVPEYINMLSIYVAPSLHESFGVAVLEASACEIPVVVSDVGGFKEVVEEGVTGFTFPVKDSRKLAEELDKLISDKTLRIKMGKDGRKHVEKSFNIKNNTEKMIEIYKKTIKK